MKQEAIQKIIRCYNIATDEIITTEPVEITEYVESETFHPDCKLPDENDWQEMDVLPENVEPPIMIRRLWYPPDNYLYFFGTYDIHYNKWCLDSDSSVELQFFKNYQSHYQWKRID